MSQIAWIAVDWGTSNLRVWAMDAADQVIATASSDRGMGALAPPEFESALLDLTAEWLTETAVMPVVACGMVGAKTGWVEAAYRAVPGAPVGAGVTFAPCADPRHRVAIIAGMAQSDPADVMRGEETQIAGFLAAEPAFVGTVCMPGTHTKWVRISDGRVQAFRTVMTGEIFAVLSQQSVLRLTVAASGWDDAVFAQTIQQTAADPASLTADLFGVRSGALVAGMSPEQARARLSGLLIGAELAATREYWDGCNVRILGGAGLSSMYARALKCVRAEARVLDGERLTLDGLTAAYRALDGE